MFIITMNSIKCILQWNPWAILHPDTIRQKYALIVLNTPIYWKPEFLLPFWSKASIRVLVDGGSNRWNKWLEDNKIGCKNGILPPSLVTGDMDSINKKMLANFQSNDNIEVVFTPNQNETDFTKSIREIRSYGCRHNIEITNIIAVSDTSGRLDQIMGNVQTLFHCREIVPEYNVFLLGSDSLSWLIEAGKHRIHVPEELRKKWCALIPVGKKCESVSTTGLKWNLENQALSFGHLVSTSNSYSGEDAVTLNTSDVLLWSMGLDNIATYYNEDL